MRKILFTVIPVDLREKLSCIGGRESLSKESKNLAERICEAVIFLNRVGVSLSNMYDRYSQPAARNRMILAGTRARNAMKDT